MWGTKLKRVIENIILIACIITFVFFGYKIYEYKKEEKSQKGLNDNLIEEAVSKKENNESDNTQDSEPISVDFNVLKSKNKDIIAWIYSEGTPINYPIVQSKDNDYYLRRLINGNYNSSGTLFMDYRNSSNFEDFNTIIYGHNMKNSAMFGTLVNYKNQSYYDEHKNMYIFTENQNYKLSIFAGFEVSSESEIYTYPKTQKTNENLLNLAKSKSTFKSEIIPSAKDKIITLSTCDYNFENARYILLGTLENKIKN